MILFYKRTCCVENEKKAEIIESIKQLSSRHGSVFAAQKQSRKNTHTSINMICKVTKIDIEKDNENSKKPKVTVEYNGSLLPYSLEVVNNSIIKFFVACRSYHCLHVLIIVMMILESISLERSQIYTVHHQFPKHPIFFK